MRVFPGPRSSRSAGCFGLTLFGMGIDKESGRLHFCIKHMGTET